MYKQYSASQYFILKFGGNNTFSEIHKPKTIESIDFINENYNGFIIGLRNNQDVSYKTGDTVEFYLNIKSTLKSIILIIKPCKNEPGEAIFIENGMSTIATKIHNDSTEIQILIPKNKNNKLIGKFIIENIVITNQ